MQGNGIRSVFGNSSLRRRYTADLPPTTSSQTAGPEPAKPLPRSKTELSYKTTKDGIIRVDISAYSLAWEKLRNYLRELFPGIKFPEKLVGGLAPLVQVREMRRGTTDEPR